MRTKAAMNTAVLPRLTWHGLKGRQRHRVGKTSRWSNDLPSTVSLFSGAGGLDWGFHSEGFSIPIAFDISPAAIRTYNRNFTDTRGIAGDLIAFGPKGVTAKVKEHIPEGSRIGIIGGPPCQGFSRANTAAQCSDPRNRFPALYLDIMRDLNRHYAVEFFVFENVLGIRDKKHAQTYRALVEGLASVGLTITEEELCALDFGIPQARRRIVLCAVPNGRKYQLIKPSCREGTATVRAAIGGLPEPAFFRRGLTPSEIPLHPNHWTMMPKSPRFKGSKAGRSDGRSFKRLSWETASPTIAFGHREIHVHPEGKRRLSIYEAMLLQGFPSSFVLEGSLSEQVEQISNAVPPPLARAIAASVKRALLAN